MSDEETPEMKALRQLHDFATATGSTYDDVMTFAGIFKRLNDAEAERDAAFVVIQQVRELGTDIIEQSRCGYLGKDILDIVGEAT